MYSQHTFSDQSTPREILNDFYKNYNLGEDGGINDPYVKIELYKKLAIYFPNFNARRKAVLKHDIHHLATGYSSLLKGETEISAWELASGCTSYPAAFSINLHGMMMGFPLNLKGIFRAFVKGRRTKNLYTDFYCEGVLDMKLADIRKQLVLDQYDEKTKANIFDVMAFSGMLLLGFLNAVFSLALIPVVVFSTLYVWMFPDKLKRVPVSVAE